MNMSKMRSILFLFILLVITISTSHLFSQFINEPATVKNTINLFHQFQI
jgi:Na+-transporting methylmalonyl-CoA/oxaloacetate decarboxylase gamma subunit